MRILVNLENTEKFREIYAEENEPLENLKYIIEAEFNIPFSEQEIKFEGKVLDNDRKLFRDYNVREDEILVINRKKLNMNMGINLNPNTNMNLSSIFDNTMKMIKQNPNLPPQNNLGGGLNNLFSFDSRVKNEAKHIREFYVNKPDELNMLFNTDPELAEIIVSMDDKKLEDLVRGRLTKIEEKKRRELDEYNKLMSADPNDADAQKKIEEMIRLKNIDENMKMAQEYLPETFLPVHMLFIHLEINRHKVVALVDTGAQSTIISEDLAKKFGVFNLCDTRFSGIAKGVGTSKIIGVIHAAQMKIGNT